MSDERDEQDRRDTAPQPPAPGGEGGTRPYGRPHHDEQPPGPQQHGQDAGPAGRQSGQQQYGQQQHGQQQYGQGPGPYGQPYGQGPGPYGQPYGQGSPRYGQDQYGQGQYGQPQYGQPQYGQPQYGQPQYGQPQYGQPQYGQGQYGSGPGAYGYPPAYGPYGSSVVPAKPAPVVAAAVLGLVFGALGVLVSLAVLLGGAALFGLAGALEDGSLGDDPFGTGTDPFAGLGADASNAFGAGLVVIGLLVVGWTVLTLWGSVWALTGRSRVLLLVGGSIAVPVTLLGLLGVATDPTAGGGAAFFSLLFFVAAVAVVVLLSLRTSARFYAAHRARRAAR